MDIKLWGKLIIAFGFILFIGIEIMKRRNFQLLLKYLEQRNYDAFFSLLDTRFMKFAYPLYNQRYMKLNAYLLMENHEETQNLLDTMLSMRTTKKQRTDLVGKAFHYYVRQNDQMHAKQMLEEIKTWNNAAMTRESQIIYDVFLLKQDQYIEEMEQRLATAKGIKKGFLEFVLSRQYENRGDQNKSLYYRELAQKDMVSKL